MKQHKAVRVTRTRLGRAVASRQRFAPGDCIATIPGRLIRDEEYGSNYCVDLGDEVGLEPAPPFRYLNHSCVPNCELLTWQEDPSGPVRLYLHALAEIRPGDELTIDYGWSAEYAIPCECGSPRCRGWIVAADEISFVQRSQEVRYQQNA